VIEWRRFVFVASAGLRGGFRDSSSVTHCFDPNIARKCTRLIVVAGHSILTAENLDGLERKDESWALLDYQKQAGMPLAFVAHAKSGIQLAKLDDEALLLFSGGQTRLEAGPRSEAASYFTVADHFGWFGNQEVRERTALEEYATDSFQNLLFSVCRFREITGKYPERITVVSFTFKQERFETVHREALRFDQSAFQFVGVDPQSRAFNTRLKELANWESKASIGPFKTDPYGCNSLVLRTKRQERNPFFRTPPYTLTCPEISALLMHCDRNFFPRENLPWRM